MHLPRSFELSADARAAVAQLVGIMNDQVMDGEAPPRWDYDELMRLEFTATGTRRPGGSIA